MSGEKPRKTGTGMNPSRGNPELPENRQEWPGPGGWPVVRRTDILAAGGSDIIEQFLIGGPDHIDIRTVGVFLAKRFIVLLCHGIYDPSGNLAPGVDRENGQKITVTKALFQDIAIPFFLKSISKHLAWHPSLSDEND